MGRMLRLDAKDVKLARQMLTGLETRRLELETREGAVLLQPNSDEHLPGNERPGTAFSIGFVFFNTRRGVIDPWTKRHHDEASILK